MPAEQWDLPPIKLPRLILHFLRQSIGAGTDVALRARSSRSSLLDARKEIADMDVSAPLQALDGRLNVMQAMID
jgi:hypothetical protein